MFFLFLSPGEVENAIEYAWQTLPLPQQRRGGEEAGGARGFSRLLSVHFASSSGWRTKGGYGPPGPAANILPPFGHQGKQHLLGR